MNQLQKYEVLARTYHIATGKMAPGKDVPVACGPTDAKADRQQYLEWIAKYHHVLRAMMQAFEDVIE